MISAIVLLLWSCRRENIIAPAFEENPEIRLETPLGFPPFNTSFEGNKPTKYGVELGRKIFNDKKLSGNNTISCASCHNQTRAFTDGQVQALGIHHRVGLRNTPPLQNLAFLHFYNWDGNLLQLERQALVPIITHEEMDSSILDFIGKIAREAEYLDLFRWAFGDEAITPERIYRSLAQYQYTLISANSKYDRVLQGGAEKFTDREERGLIVFQQKCESCHSGALFTDQSFRNIGFPINPSAEEAGRARVTGVTADYMRFRVPSLRNIEYTAPYGSFGQFPTLESLLDYLDSGVLAADNLDPILKLNGNRIPMSKQEKEDIISFLHTLSDPGFVNPE